MITFQEVVTSILDAILGLGVMIHAKGRNVTGHSFGSDEKHVPCSGGHLLLQGQRAAARSGRGCHVQKISSLGTAHGSRDVGALHAAGSQTPVLPTCARTLTEKWHLMGILPETACLVGGVPER